MRTDPSALSTLRAVLRAEIEGHRALLDVLMREQDALRTADPEAVIAAAATKARHVGELESLARQRTDLLIASGIAFGPGGIQATDAPPALAASIQEDWITLRDTAAQAQQTNELNGRLIARHQRHNETALASLLQATGRTPVYGADGRPERTTTGRPLISI